MIAQRVEKHIVRQTDHYYKMLCDFCHEAKNLYNHANYIVRQEFINNNKWLRYADIDKLLREDNEYPDYKQMPTAQCAQQVLRILDNNWTSFFKSIKEFLAGWSHIKSPLNASFNNFTLVQIASSGNLSIFCPQTVSGHKGSDSFLEMM